MVAIASMLAALVLVAPAARADPVSEAQAYVILKTGQHVNVLKTDCSPLTVKNGKNVCFLSNYLGAMLIGNVNKRKEAAVREEYDTLVTLAGWHVSVAEVGSQFIVPLPCSTSEVNFTCQGFVEQRLTGAEVYWAGYQQELVEAPKIGECVADNPTYLARVRRAYASIQVVDKNNTLASLVAGKPESWRDAQSWRDALWDDVASYGQAFASHDRAVIDLQGFVAANGRMHVFDPAGLNPDKKFYTCWSAAMLALAHIIQAEH
jgi:hypothetical protein